MKNVSKALLTLGLAFSMSAANAAGHQFETDGVYVLMPVADAYGNISMATFPAERTLRSHTRVLRSTGYVVPEANLYALTPKQMRTYLSNLAAQGQDTVQALTDAGQPEAAAELAANVGIVADAAANLNQAIEVDIAARRSPTPPPFFDGGLDALPPMVDDQAIPAAEAPVAPNFAQQALAAIVANPVVQGAIGAVQAAVNGAGRMFGAFVNLFSKRNPAPKTVIVQSAGKAARTHVVSGKPTRK